MCPKLPKFYSMTWELYGLIKSLLTNVPCEFRNVFWTNLELKTMYGVGFGGWRGGREGF
jgi:hypothetical protein